MLTAPALSDQLRHSLATDYFFLREQLTESQIELLVRVRNFVDDEVLPVIGGYWGRAAMPWPLLKRSGELGIVGDDTQGYGWAGLTRSRPAWSTWSSAAATAASPRSSGS